MTSVLHEAEQGYVKTAAYNYISRKAHVHGVHNVEMKGKSIIHPSAHIRGDFHTVRIGRYCHIGSESILRPPSYQSSIDMEDGGNGNGSESEPSELEPIQFLPLVIGNHTRIGRDCVIEAASIGSSVFIGDGCVISKRVIVKDCCYIEQGTVVPSDMVIPPFSRVKGCPARIVEEGFMPESVAVTFVDECVEQFTDFVKTLEGGG